MAKDFRKKREGSTETVHLGAFKHIADDFLVLKLEHKDIPYPNSPVLFKGNQIGKVDEIFGSINDVFISVKPNDGSKSSYKEGCKFEGYKDKFMFRNRFLPREEVEKMKEKTDSINKNKGVIHKNDFKNKDRFAKSKDGFYKNSFKNKGGLGKNDFKNKDRFYNKKENSNKKFKKN